MAVRKDEIMVWIQNLLSRENNGRQLGRHKRHTSDEFLQSFRSRNKTDLMLLIVVVVVNRLEEHREKYPIVRLWTPPSKILVLLVVQKKPSFWVKGAEMFSCVLEVQPCPGMAAFNWSGKIPLLKYVAIFATSLFAAFFIQLLSSRFLLL